MKIIEEKIGTLVLDDKVDITDPCYDKTTWCRITSDCKPGKYTGYVEISDEGAWGKRIASISIYKDDNKVSPYSMEFIGTIGVDAGLAGFFNNKPDYDDNWMEFLVESGVFKSKDEYNNDKDYYSISYGLFSRSGYGDGGYNVYATSERDAFRIEFIIDEEDDDD